MFFNKNSLFLLLSALFCTQINSMEQRDLIMIIDDHMELGEEEEHISVDATLITLFAALEAQAAPIIVSGSVWRNFARARFNFNQKKNIPNTVQHIAYNQVYLPINKELSKLSTQHEYNAPMIANAINKELTSDSPLRSEFENALDNIEKLVGKFNTPEHRLFKKEFDCYATPFDPTNWDIYTYGHALYILIPHVYANRIHKQYKKEFLQSLQFKDTTGKPLEKEFALLGIKTNNLIKLDMFDAYALPYAEPHIQFTANQGLPMNALLITNKDTITSGSSLIIHPFVWSVYLNGHGSYYLSPNMQKHLDIILNSIHKNRTKLEKLIGISKYTNHQSLIAQLELRIQETHNKIAELHDKNLIEQITEIEKHKEKFKQALCYAKSLKYNYEWAYDIIFKNQNINIAGMPSLAFTKLLQFFNNEVDTYFLFYETCFAGARNLLYPYLSEFDQAIEYNYTIATGTVSDISSLTLNATLLLDLNTMFLLNEKAIITPSNIFQSDNSIKLIPNRAEANFKQFFQGLHTDKPLAQTLQYVHRETKSIIGTEKRVKQVTAEYKPTIRLPGSTTFYVNDFDKKIQKISRVTISVANLQGKLEIDGEKTPGVILNTYFVPTTIYFSKALPISIISSIYEPTLQGPWTGPITGFYFKNILTDDWLVMLADKLLQGALIKTALGEREPSDNPVPKIFICDNIFSFKDSNAYKKVLIFNNALLPTSLTKKESSDDVSLSTTGMIYTLKNVPTIQASITTINNQNGKLTTEDISRQLETDEEKEAYNNLYDEAKNELTQKANSEGLTIIPLEAVAKTLQSRAIQSTPEKK